MIHACTLIEQKVHRVSSFGHPLPSIIINGEEKRDIFFLKLVLFSFDEKKKAGSTAAWACWAHVTCGRTGPCFESELLLPLRLPFVWTTYYDQKGKKFAICMGLLGSRGEVRKGHCSLRVGEIYRSETKQIKFATVDLYHAAATQMNSEPH